MRRLGSLTNDESQPRQTQRATSVCLSVPELLVRTHARIYSNKVVTGEVVGVWRPRPKSCVNRVRLSDRLGDDGWMGPLRTCHRSVATGHQLARARAFAFSFASSSSSYIRSEHSRRSDRRRDAVRTRHRDKAGRGPAPRARASKTTRSCPADVRTVRLHGRRGRNKGPGTACAGDQNGMNRVIRMDRYDHGVRHPAGHVLHHGSTTRAER